MEAALTTEIPERRTIALTAAALVAFAANSILCRLALQHASIDAGTFTLIRVLSGAVMLVAITATRTQPLVPMAGSWTAAVLLSLYALPFALAYTQLSAGTGALILFGGVQVTMLAGAVRSGERPRALQWAGAGFAVAGLVILLLPGLAAPPLAAALLMAVSGMSWGIYSLRGRAASNPLSHTTGNFVRAVPLIAIASLLVLPRVHVEARGVALAIASGAVASGLGYVAWYAALRGLSGMHSAVVQLATPVLTATGGVLLLSEAVSGRLLLSSVMVLGGIGIAIANQGSTRPRHRN